MNENKTIFLLRHQQKKLEKADLFNKNIFFKFVSYLILVLMKYGNAKLKLKFFKFIAVDTKERNSI